MNQEPSVSELNRRAFMRTALSAGAAFCIVPRHVLGGPNQVAPSDKINVAIIGCGGQSLIDMDNLIKFPEIQYVAMADPMKEWDYREFYFGGFAGCEAAKRKAEDYYAGQRGKSSFKSIRTYADFREMLDQESDIDAVTIETTDNLHALATLAALEKGKHVYCQKPLTHDIYEARVVTEAAGFWILDAGCLILDPGYRTIIVMGVVSPAFGIMAFCRVGN